MIAFGCATTDEREFRNGATLAIERVAERDSLLLRRHARKSVHEPYNEMLAAACGRDELEAVVLIHQDVTIESDGFLSAVRAILAASPKIAVVGALGARGDRLTSVTERHGRLALPRLGPGGSVLDFSHAPREVDWIDGSAIVLSARAARELRFDGAVGDSLDACAVDVCLQARAQGDRVVAGGLAVARRSTGRELFDRRRWTRSAVALKRKWDV